MIKKKKNKHLLNLRDLGAVQEDGPIGFRPSREAYLFHYFPNLTFYNIFNKFIWKIANEKFGKSEKERK